MSFRFKIIIGVALLEALTLSILIYAMYGFLQTSHANQLRAYAQATANNFSSMIEDSILALDLARLQAFADELVGQPNVVFARIYDAGGVELAMSGRTDTRHKGFVPDSELRHVDDGVFDISTPVLVEGQLYGQVEIGISVDEIQAVFRETLFWGLSIGAIELVVVALFSLALGVYLTRQLQHLKVGVQRVADGDLGYQVPVTGADELADAAIAFNSMSQNLRSQAEQLRAVFALSPDGFISLDSQGVVRMATPRVCEMLGVNGGQMVGVNKRQLESMLQALSSREQPFTRIADVLQRTYDGQSRRLSGYDFEIDVGERRILRVTVHRGNFADVALLLHFRDITREMEMEKIKSDFVATAAHELRTPLTSIYGFAELMIELDVSASDREEFIQTIFHQSELLIKIINDLLDLSRIQARADGGLSLQDVSLTKLVDEVLESFRLQYPKRLQIELDDDPGKLHADPTKLSHALINVIANAFKYSADEQVVKVRTLARFRDGQFWLGIEVTDHGIGMTPSQVNHCFDRFWRADTSGAVPGTGLGLSLVKEIIDLHHGRIDVQSEVKQGTVVTILLPSVWPEQSQQLAG